ncbi:hypothetical protein GCM10020255_008630 [Rhodococcus baikonurensis]
MLKFERQIPARCNCIVHGAEFETLDVGKSIEQASRKPWVNCPTSPFLTDHYRGNLRAKLFEHFTHWGGQVNIDEYQRQAWKFDQHHDRPETGITIALLGLGGEVGTLQTNQKKRVRDGDVHSDHRAALVEDLGDIPGTSPTQPPGSVSISVKSHSRISTRSATDGHGTTPFP